LNPVSRSDLEAHLKCSLPSANLVLQEVANAGRHSTVQLALLNPAFPQSTLTRDEQYNLLHNPLYWVFCWPAGQVLAQKLLEKPQLVAGLRVLDFGCGSGVVGIAASMAGAAQVYCLDSDPIARLATKCNQEINRVEVIILESLPDDMEFDLIVATDVMYDRENHGLLDLFSHRSPKVIVADSRRATYPSSYRKTDQMTASPVPDFDVHREFAQVEIWQADQVQTT
jgi:predicted nicotinamide N-methyase